MSDQMPTLDATTVAPIRVSGLRKRYGRVMALEGVDVTVEPGTVHCLVGPNGSGKTTLLRTLLGLVEPSAGEVSVPDVRLGTAFQRPSHYDQLTVAENLEVFGALADADSDWAETVLDRLGLDVVRNRIAGELSGGYSRKLDLALALQKEPAYLLLDEPLGDLDDVTKLRLVEFLEAYRDAGHGVVVSTHNLGQFAGSVDHLTIVYDGEVLLDAPREDIDVADDDLQEFYVERVLGAASDSE
ncbi:ATP-binding cassette domain-containing protein [Haloglomus salinum]|uniref:ATP-binding cassette domain-containing protein n=1 Tax=Haloglomus salinum TaxID=2962673 RepID=UPI0020C94F0F|nr:ABC transporter ATP-binding protein [Haloglomus salinum]